MTATGLRNNLLRAAAILPLTLLIPLESTVPAFADSSVTGVGGTITVTSSGSSTTSLPGDIVASSTTKYKYYEGWPISQTIPVYDVYMPQVIDGAPGYSNEPCLTMVLSSQTTSYNEAMQLQVSATQTWNSLDPLYPSCNPVSGTTSQSVNANPSSIISTYWQNTVRNQLPTPQFKVPPGYALTGLRAYLTSSCLLSKSFSDNTPLGNATITASGQLWVRWNSDKGWSGPYDTCGRPWPNGTIHHVYEASGTAAISVRETWTAAWSLGENSGTLQGLYTQPGSLILPIHSITSEIYS